MRSALALLVLLASGAAVAQTDASIIPDDAPEWKPIEGAVDEARDEGRILLLHGYASWCGWCARLDQDVYTVDAVQEYLADHFEVTRLDIENRETIDFFDYRLPTAWLASGLGITSTPTTVFMDAETGEVITRLPGYADAETFLNALQFVQEAAYETQSFQEFVDSKTAAAVPAEPASPLIPVAD
ncbi:MAG: thioredoxin fold domain-containing protein [Bacteroidota bacterium]